VPAQMKAAVLHGREDVRIEKVDVPRLDPGDVLLRTKVALTCGTDVKVFRRGYHARMISPPSVFGHEAAGIVEEIGRGTEGVAAGHRRGGRETPLPAASATTARHDSPSLCDDLLFWNGAYAEFVRHPGPGGAPQPRPSRGGGGFPRGGDGEPLACVVRGVEESWIGRGQSVAVFGAGPIGLMFVALARLGARTSRSWVGTPAGWREPRELGAEAAIVAAPGRDLADELRKGSRHGHGFDVVIEAVGLPETSRRRSARSAREASSTSSAAARPRPGSESTRSGSTTRSSPSSRRSTTRRRACARHSG